MQREHVAGLNEDTTYVDSTQTIEEYIHQTDWRINANANTSYSNAGLVNNVAGKIIANYWLNERFLSQPYNTRWMTPTERRLAQVRIAEDAGEADRDTDEDS